MLVQPGLSIPSVPISKRFSLFKSLEIIDSERGEKRNKACPDVYGNNDSH